MTGYDNLLSESKIVEDILGHIEFAEIEHIIKEEKKRLKFTTSKLWIKYMDMISVMNIHVHVFIKIGRIGNGKCTFSQ